MEDEQIDPNLAVAQGKHKLHDTNAVSKSRKTMEKAHISRDVGASVAISLNVNGI